MQAAGFSERIIRNPADERQVFAECGKSVEDRASCWQPC
jgi:hypothetical protein